ncbi:MAG: 4Fe-4S dicluster-binding protein [Sulfolobales archaeon]|nr:4Fe-4S binding protein [Desulfurococcaceae archaeon]
MVSLYINPSKCVACTHCVPFCPTGAIQIVSEGGRTFARVDEDRCVECWICYRVARCPKDAIEPTPPEKMSFERRLKFFFASATAVWPETGMAGRGTEEMKTNDVTGRFKFGEIGFALDMGRPTGVGVRVSDIEKVCKAIAPYVTFEPENPVTKLLIDPKTGEVRDPKLRNVYLLSAVVEAKTSKELAPKVLQIIKEVSKELNTVISVGLVSRVKPDGEPEAFEVLRQVGIEPRPNMKINIGLGKPFIGWE